MESKYVTRDLCTAYHEHTQESLREIKKDIKSISKTQLEMSRSQLLLTDKLERSIDIINSTESLFKDVNLKLLDHENKLRENNLEHSTINDSINSIRTYKLNKYDKLIKVLTPSFDKFKNLVVFISSCLGLYFLILQVLDKK